VADCHGYVTVGQYDDGRPGDIFLRVATAGSTLACFACSGWATTSGFS
jgi:ribonucleoside-diphosphate reductase alpha chain